MGRSPCCDRSGLKKGPWTAEEDEKLKSYIELHGASNWRTLPKNAGLERCGKSCRLRWTNYLRPDIKRGRFSFEEEETIIQLHSVLGNKWSAIAARLPGRTDNEIKNYWNTHIRKRLLKMGIDPVTHTPRFDLMEYLSSSAAMMANYNHNHNHNHSHTHNNNTATGQLNLLGLQALLNPGLVGLLTSLTSSPSTSSSPSFNPAAQPYNTSHNHHQQQLGGLISQVPQFHPGHLLPSLAAHEQPAVFQPLQRFGQDSGQQMEMGPSQTDLSCQTSPENSSDYYPTAVVSATAALNHHSGVVGEWDATNHQLIKSEDQRFGFDSSLESTPLTASPNIDHFNGGSDSATFIDNLLNNNSQSNIPLDGSCCGVDRGGSGLLSYEIPLGSWDLSEFL